MAGLWLHVMRASQGPWRQPCVRWLKPSLAWWPFPLGRPRWTDRLSSVPGLWGTAPRRLPGASPQAAITNMVRALRGPPPRAPLPVPNKGTALGSSVPEAGTCPGRGNGVFPATLPCRPTLASPASPRPAAWPECLPPALLWFGIPPAADGSPYPAARTGCVCPFLCHCELG